MDETRSENKGVESRRSILKFSTNSAAHAALFAFAVVFYTLTLNGDVQPADSGELQIAAITFGIPHPPGYPLFTMLGWLFARVPIGSAYARVSFLSVVASAMTLVLVSLTVKQVLDHDRGTGGQRDGKRPSYLPAGLLAALALGSSTTFWAQATTTNIRSLTVFFTALMMYASARAYATGRASALALFAVAFGLGVGHHVSLIFIGVVLGAYVLFIAWRAGRPQFRRTAIYAIGVFAVTQLVWLYLPVRDMMGARFAPGNLTTLEGLFFHIFARGFAGDMLAFVTTEFLSDRLALLPTLLTFQFSPPVLVGMIIAALALIWRFRALGASWLLACLVHLFITVTYRAPQTVEYAMPCWVILCIVLGVGLGRIASQNRSSMRWTEIFFFTAKPRKFENVSSVFTSSCLCGRAIFLRLIPIVPLLAVIAFAGRDAMQRWPSFAYLGRDRSTRAFAEAVLRVVQPGSIVLAQWHQATPMWALQDIEGLRRDVRVDYVFPRGAQPYPETFAAQAAQHAGTHTTYATSLFADELAIRGLQAIPLTGYPAWRVAERFPLSMAPDSILFDQRIGVIRPIELDGRLVEAGQSLAMDLGWYSRAAPQVGDSITVRVMRSDGRLAANADVRLSPSEQPGAYYAQRVVLGVPLDLPPGAYRVFVGAYRLAGDGFVQYRDPDGAEFVSVATLTVVPASSPPATRHPMPSLALGPTDRQPQLIGVDYDTGVLGQLRVWTHWRLGRSAIEVALMDADGRLLAPARSLSAATDPARLQYLSLPFDIAPARGVRVAPLGQHLPDYRDGQRYVPFADQMALVGSSAYGDTSLKVDLYWLAMRPLVDDYIVSVRVEGDGLYRTHDGVPALGAIPTLKWIRDSQVMDRHPFDLGDYRGLLRGSVVVYDSVSRLPLPPLDERYENTVTIPIPSRW